MLLQLIFFTAVASAQALFGKKLIDIPKIITNPLEKIVMRNKCLEDLGCFYTGSPFYHPILRPISFSPFDLEDMNTKFWLYTPQNKDTPYDLQNTVESLDNSSFDESLPVKFLIHGYLTDLKEGDSRHRMKDALLELAPLNVIIVDWTASNGRPYFQAVANARVVGAQVAQKIRFLQDTRNVDPGNVHLIGHSLGSHISGWAGERTPGLGRISGMDPAGPYFTTTEEQVRLDRSDALFVDIIHSNAGDISFGEKFGLGIPEPIGHIDFYPNGGQHQPGCKPTIVNRTVVGINVTAVSDGDGIFSLMAISCDHNQANEFYIASIAFNNCTFWGTACKDYNEFTRSKGECELTPTKQVMGYFAQKPREDYEDMKYYLKTGGESPYCLPSPDEDVFE